MDFLSKFDDLFKKIKQPEVAGDIEYVIVGLGNPEPKYDMTRHNIGFAAIDEISIQNNIKVNKVKHKGLVGVGAIAGKKVMLVKPQTYMNESGICLGEIMRYYKLNTEQFIVLYDDIDIDVGRLRVRPGGSSGTHNGMRSIIYHLKEDSFPRVRIGVGRPKTKDYNLANYVLGKFKEDELTTMGDVLVRAAAAVKEIIASDVNTAMNKYNAEGKR